VRVDGNQRLYRVDADRLSEVRRQLEGFWGDRLVRRSVQRDLHTLKRLLEDGAGRG
jgi:hypothetical protein